MDAVREFTAQNHMRRPRMRPLKPVPTLDICFPATAAPLLEALEAAVAAPTEAELAALEPAVLWMLLLRLFALDLAVDAAEVIEAGTEPDDAGVAL